jgi:hypothetical protein|tara:strand:- start:2274 stop:2615 length:342 start_codon:yes stop_codon:yes gene_type:complete
MISQIFRKQVPNNILFDLLSQICIEKNDKYYFINVFSFKKAEFKKLLDDFISTLDDYYYSSKKKYITRKLNYNRFITIIRQICKNNNIPFSSNINYERSSYNIGYFIYYAANN